MTSRSLSLIIVVAATFACIPPAPVVQQSREVTTSYVLGRRDSAVVGARAVAVKDYMVRRAELPGWQIDQAIELRADRLSCDQPVGTQFGFGPTRRVGESEFRSVLLMCGRSEIALAVDSSGHPTGEWTTGMGRWVQGRLTLTPQDARFRRAVNEEVDLQGGFTNYELLYGGTDGRSFTLTYREYTPTDMARPAFSQTLTFQNDSESIRFRNLKLQIHRVTSEQLVFTVVSDRP